MFSLSSSTKILIISLLLPLLILPPRASGEGTGAVTISILSKHLRLLREGKENRLLFQFPEGTAIRNRYTGGSYRSGHLRISYRKNGEWLFEFDKNNSINLNAEIVHPRNGSSFNIAIDGEERQYPLPLFIKPPQRENALPEITIEETPEKYSLYSATAEYGKRAPEEREAVLALAHIILARYRYRKNNPVHKGFAFCDLTHCQVYRGTIECGLEFNDDWSIDPGKLKSEPLFHSRCGGRTLDGRVICAGDEGYRSVRDILFRDGIILCDSESSSWERSLSYKDLADIFHLNNGGLSPDSIKTNDPCDYITMSSTVSRKKYPRETFRLTVNRVKGWNFLKSNNFTLNTESGGIRFSGKGLGHGLGICQHGALELSARGYTRYEILEHYYPDISFKASGKNSVISPCLSFCMFDIFSGATGSTLCPAFIKRKFPPGSIWKLVVSLYLAAEREDIFREYRYTCAGKSVDKTMPERCWDPGGHGNVPLEKALPHSCNLFFASLYRVIDFDKFKRFCSGMFNTLGIQATLPPVKTKSEFAELLSGLDFRLSLSVRDLIKIAGVIYPGKNHDPAVNSVKEKIPGHLRMKIFEMLHDTFIFGTARTMIEEYPHEPQYALPGRQEFRDIFSHPDNELWGKTSTVIDGTNKPESYGIFLGGKGNRGIVVIIRKGNGHLASQWARVLLEKNK